jgi:hypothetical protein
MMWPSMGTRCEFDEVNKILLVRFDGHLTDELLLEGYATIRQYSISTDSQAAIFDFSDVTRFDITSKFVRRLAQNEPAMPKADQRPRIAVVPQTHAFGLARMFQIVSETTRPLFSVVRTVDDALEVLRAKTPNFKPIGL